MISKYSNWTIKIFYLDKILHMLYTNSRGGNFQHIYVILGVWSIVKWNSFYSRPNGPFSHTAKWCSYLNVIWSYPSVFSFKEYFLLDLRFLFSSCFKVQILQLLSIKPMYTEFMTLKGFNGFCYVCSRTIFCLVELNNISLNSNNLLTANKDSKNMTRISIII